MINWREKFIATAIHFVATLLLAALAAGVIFLLWYPSPFATMIGGGELFLLVVGCDLALGPLLSLVVYSSRKSRRELLLDYSVIGLLQVGSLVYGVMTTADARPVYVAFSLDRFEVVLAGDLRESELAQARDPEYRDVPWTGPRFVSVVIPPGDRSDALFEALSGNEEHRRPKFYVPFETELDNVCKRAEPLDVLERKKPASKALLSRALDGLDVPEDRLEWLPVHHFRGFWTAIIDTATGKPVAYIDLDPYE
jgi:hypothetical protein